MIKTKCLLILGLMFICQISIAADLSSNEPSNLDLTNAQEIESAQRINSAMENISSRVMACIEEKNGEVNGCTCETRERCPFKEEYDTFITIFCAATDNYPKWKQYDVFYQEGDGSVGHTLSTRNIYLHYGQECK